MKTKKTLIVIGLSLFFCLMYLFADGNVSVAKKVETTPELVKEYPSKPHHAALSLECIHCHEGQGDNPKEFETPGDKGCLSCHKDKHYLADRLKFMDQLKVNPHNSIHDGPTLFCDECHNEHKPSVNMCIECHEHDIKLWMKATP